MPFTTHNKLAGLAVPILVEGTINPWRQSIQILKLRAERYLVGTAVLFSLWWCVMCGSVHPVRNTHMHTHEDSYNYYWNPNGSGSSLSLSILLILHTHTHTQFRCSYSSHWLTLLWLTGDREDAPPTGTPGHRHLWHCKDFYSAGANISEIK